MIVDWYYSAVATKELPVIRERGVCCELPVVRPAWAAERAALMKAMADPTRVTILATLLKADGPVCICDFVAGLDLGQPTISHHMARLREAGLVDSEKRGIWVYYRLRDRMPARTRNLLSQLLA